MRFSASSEIKEMTDPNLNIHEFAGCSKMNQNCCAFLCKSSMKQTSESKQAEKQHWNVMIKRQHQNASNRNIVHCCSYCCAHPATFVISKNKGEHSVSNNQVAETHIATMWISVRSPHMTWNDQCNIFYILQTVFSKWRCGRLWKWTQLLLSSSRKCKELEQNTKRLQVGPPKTIPPGRSFSPISNKFMNPWRDTTSWLDPPVKKQQGNVASQRSSHRTWIVREANTVVVHLQTKHAQQTKCTTCFDVVGHSPIPLFCPRGCHVSACAVEIDEMVNGFSRPPQNIIFKLSQVIAGLAPLLFIHLVQTITLAVNLFSMEFSSKGLWVS